jgi:hypothetical protein
VADLDVIHFSHFFGGCDVFVAKNIGQGIPLRALTIFLVVA